MKGKYDTPKGTFSILNKARNVNLKGQINQEEWDVTVSYWMPFIDGAYGMHDASFRSESEFKNHRTYITNGSHGCVNMPPASAAQLYGILEPGTPILIY
jgi:lipoprotein-anchoring transpeptidase ErfK/SrfK